MPAERKSLPGVIRIASSGSPAHRLPLLGVISRSCFVGSAVRSLTSSSVFQGTAYVDSSGSEGLSTRRRAEFAALFRPHPEGKGTSVGICR
jgi:hypothetical protein